MVDQRKELMRGVKEEAACEDDGWSRVTRSGTNMQTMLRIQLFFVL